MDEEAIRKDGSACPAGETAEKDWFWCESELSVCAVCGSGYHGCLYVRNHRIHGA